MTNCRGKQVVIRVIMADRVGFEPTDGHDPSPVFETGTLNRSDICPNLAESVGFEPTAESPLSPVFKTGSINRSDNSPCSFA